MVLDTLLRNGVCYTMTAEGEAVEAIGIKDGLIVFAGSNASASEYRSKRTIDLNGRIVIPGMADAHMHMYAHCQNLALVDLHEVRSMDEMIHILKEKSLETPEGNWIKGVNFDQSKFIENRFPTKDDLDKVSSKHPIVIKRCCLHAVVANTLALETVGVVNGYDPGEGGIVEIDALGHPSGILREQSTKVFDEIMPDPLADETAKRRIMKDVFHDMSSKGITTIHTYAAKIWRYDEDIELYREFQESGELPVRVTVCMDELFDKENVSVEELSNPHRLVQQGAYKLFTDGSLGSRSAALKEPYTDDPDNRGFVVCSQETLNEKVLIAYKKGLQPAIHAIGDAALDMTLAAIEKCLEQVDSAGRLPFRIIHVQMIDDELMKRMKRLPVVLDIQPVFLCTDLHWIEDRIGPERLKSSYCWKRFVDEGFIQTGGSDCPVESYDPMKGIFAAVARTDMQGHPQGGFLPGECLSMYEAISLFTKNPHYATGQQEMLGTLEVGKFADLVVLDRDPFTMAVEELLNISVEKTFIAGRQVYSVE